MNEISYTIKSNKNKKYMEINKINENKIIIISDTHIGSALENIDYLHIVYEYALKNNIKTILHGGDLLQGTYTNVLKEVHENLDTYVGQKICYTGYVYRVSDLENTQFILARDMSLKNTSQTVIVGFLCNLQNASDFDTYSWVKITGTIEKGNYLGEIPCIGVEQIEKVEQPENCTVPEPNENFIQTSVIY